MRWLDLANMPTNNPGTGMPLPKWEISKMEMKEGDTLVVRLPCMMRAADIDEMRDGIRSFSRKSNALTRRLTPYSLLNLDAGKTIRK